MPSPPLRSRADVLTDAPDRYAKQLVAHVSRTITFITEEPRRLRPSGTQPPRSRSATAC